MHVNIHGPMASGKTRNGEALKRHYGCTTIIDEGMQFNGRIRVPAGGKALILTIQPVQHLSVRNVPIQTALREIRRG